MDTRTGRIILFQNDEDKKLYEEEQKRLLELNAKFSSLLKLENLPKSTCELCAGAGAVQSKITMKWIPCICTNPVQEKKQDDIDKGIKNK